MIRIRSASLLPLLLAATGTRATAQAVVLEDAALRTAGSLPHSDFGGDVALNGTRLFVALRDAERVQVFVDTGSGYALETELVAPDGVDGDLFGSSVASDGLTCVVGAPRHDGGGADAGAAYVYRFDGASWAFEAKLLGWATQAGDRFGSTVDTIGQRIAVGAPLADSPGGVDQGSAHVFDRTGAPWTEVAAFTGPDSVGNDQFGWQVALGLQTVVVASQNASAGYPYSGAAYVYRDLGLGPTFEHKLVPPVVGGTFGHRLDVYGHRIAVGMPYGGADGAGRVCVFEHDGSAWGAASQCSVPYGAALDQLGSSVALAGDHLVTGAIFDWIWDDWSGSAVVFEKVGSAWEPSLRLVPSDGLMDGAYGQAVDFDGTRVVVGAPHWTGGPNPPPSYERVYVHALPDRVGTAACAGDGSVTPCPCGNESPVGYDMGCENGYSRAGNLAASGSASLTADDLFLSVEHLTRVATVPAYGVHAQLVAGTSLLTGTTLGDGLLCAGGTVQRIGAPKRATTGGLAWWGPDLALSQGWTAGQTLHFQVLYRDPALGGCGAHVNTSNALTVTFVP